MQDIHAPTVHITAIHGAYYGHIGLGILDGERFPTVHKQEKIKKKENIQNLQFS